MPDEHDPAQEEDVERRIVELGERLHDLELQSADSLGTRAGALIGFSGVVLALTAGLARDAFGKDAALGSFGDPAVAVLYVLSITVLVAAAVQGVRAARPSARSRVSISVLRKYRRRRPRTEEIDDHYGRKQEEAAEDVAATNTTRGEALQWAFRWLAIGVGLVGGQATIIGIDRLTEVL